MGEPFVWKGKTLLSGVDPARLCERAAASTPVKDRALYLCPSPLYGWGLKKFLERLESEAPASAVLCVEADKELYELSLKNIEGAVLANKKFRIANISGGGAICAFSRQAWGARAFASVEQLRLTGGWQLFPALYGDLADALRQEIATEWSNAATMTKLGALYIRAAMRNLGLIPAFPSIDSLSFSDAPVLVLGAGPSMDGALDALEGVFGEKLKKRALRPFRIVCVDTCLPALRERGIESDLAVILESQHWNIRDFIGVGGWDIPCAVALSALPLSAKALGGRKYLFFTPWADLSIFKRMKKAALLPASVPPLGSVGLCAVEIARRLTSGHLIVSGIDLCFSLDKYHGRGCAGHKDKLASVTRFSSPLNAQAAFADGIFAESARSPEAARSSPIMRQYRGLFQREFSGDGRVFCMSGGGLDLGVKTVGQQEAAAILAGGCGQGKAARPVSPVSIEGVEKKLTAFLQGEKKMLLELRDILTGRQQENAHLNILVDECDYLWAHFPDYAGGRRPEFFGESDLSDAQNAQALSFLKRLRFEIDRALVLLQMAEEAAGKHGGNL